MSKFQPGDIVNLYAISPLGGKAFIDCRAMVKAALSQDNMYEVVLEQFGKFGGKRVRRRVSPDQEPQNIPPVVEEE